MPYTSSHKITVLEHASRGLSAIAELLVEIRDIGIQLFIYDVHIVVLNLTTGTCNRLHNAFVKLFNTSLSPLIPVIGGLFLTLECKEALLAAGICDPRPPS